MGGGAGAGGGSGAGAGGGGIEAYSSSSTDIELLDGLADEVIEEHSDEHVDDKGDGAAADERGRESAGEGGEGGAEHAPAWLETAPDELKGMLSSNAVSGAAKEWLKKTFEEFTGFKEGITGDPEAAAEIIDLFPGGMEDIRSAHGDAQNFRREMTQFESGDATQQTELLAGLLQQNADAFVQLVPAGLDLLKQTLRDDWTHIASGMSREFLDTITDNKFGTFFDGLVELATKYNSLLDTNAEEAAKFASKLGGAALQMADWWTSAKPKLGYDKAPAERAAAGTGRTPVTRGREESDGETRIALREAQLFEQQLGLSHDQAINPLIRKEIASAIKARAMALPATWQQRVMASVAKAVVKNLQADRAFQAKLSREYHRGDANRPQQWDRSDRVALSLVNAAKARAAKLIPTLVKRALDNLATLAPGKTAAAGTPGAGVRSGTRTATGGAGGVTDADLKDLKVSDADLLARITGA